MEVGVPGDPLSMVGGEPQSTTESNMILQLVEVQ